jgi:hypothetical protein
VRATAHAAARACLQVALGQRPRGGPGGRAFQQPRDLVRAQQGQALDKLQVLRVSLGLVRSGADALSQRRRLGCLLLQQLLREHDGFLQVADAQRQVLVDTQLLVQPLRQLLHLRAVRGACRFCVGRRWRPTSRSAGASTDGASSPHAMIPLQGAPTCAFSASVSSTCFFLHQLTLHHDATSALRGGRAGADGPSCPATSPSRTASERWDACCCPTWGTRMRSVKRPVAAGHVLHAGWFAGFSSPSCTESGLPSSAVRWGL